MDKSKMLKIYQEKCLKGKHPSEKVYSHGPGSNEKVVRWCPICGSVVGDVDYDNRTKSGAVFETQSPLILKLVDLNENLQPYSILILGAGLSKRGSYNRMVDRDYPGKFYLSFADDPDKLDILFFKFKEALVNRFYRAVVIVAAWENIVDMIPLTERIKKIYTGPIIANSEEAEDNAQLNKAGCTHSTEDKNFFGTLAEILEI